MLNIDKLEIREIIKLQQLHKNIYFTFGSGISYMDIYVYVDNSLVKIVPNINKPLLESAAIRISRGWFSEKRYIFDEQKLNTILKYN